VLSSAPFFLYIMPLNEAQSFRRSSLTKQQRFEQEAAIYGLHPEQQRKHMQNNNFTPAQLDQMRAILEAHDDGKRGVIKEFDLNKPPQAPYRYEEFPRLVYRAGKHQLAHDEAGLAEALEHGWSKEPHAAIAHVAAELDAESAAEAATVDKQLARSKKKGA
jgi:hypothetical protein